jgi:hypothetical protein
MRHVHIATALLVYLRIKQFLESKVPLVGIDIAQPAMKFIVNGLKTELLFSFAHACMRCLSLFTTILIADYIYFMLASGRFLFELA